MHSIIRLCCSVAVFFSVSCYGVTPACEIKATGANATIGSIGGEEDAVLFSGYNVILLTSGELAVHDPINEKLLIFERKEKEFDCTKPIVTVELGGAPISTIVQDEGVIYGIDLSGTIKRLYPQDQEVVTGESFGGVAHGNTGAINQQLVLAQMALSHPLSGGKAIWPGAAGTEDVRDHSTGEIGLSPEDNRLVSVPNGMIVIEGVEYLHAFTWQSANSGVLKIWPKSLSSTSLELPVKVPAILGAVDIMRASSKGFMVAVESVDMDQEKGVRVEDHIFNFTRDGKLLNHQVTTIPKPSTKGSWTPMNTPAQSDPLAEGRIFYFFRSEGALINVPIDLQKTGDVSISNNPVEIKFPVPDPKRDILIRRADAFLNASWITNEKNLNVLNPTWSCLAPYVNNDNRWAQPIFLKNLRPGIEVYGVPYLWGGKAGWEDYLSKIKSGGIAGNVCTKVAKGKPVSVPGAAGIDCSGFVSRVWELNRGKNRVDLSTVAIGTNEFSRPLKSLTELQPGDVLNKAGVHVRLFAGWIRTPFGLRIRSYESTTDSICSGTCMRDLRVRAYVGYTPRGYPD